MPAAPGPGLQLPPVKKPPSQRPARRPAWGRGALPGPAWPAPLWRGGRLPGSCLWRLAGPAKRRTWRTEGPPRPSQSGPARVLARPQPWPAGASIPAPAPAGSAAAGGPLGRLARWPPVPAA
eukprot:10639594-Lingulodinium_polyedra.AAC.1